MGTQVTDARVIGTRSIVEYTVSSVGDISLLPGLDKVAQGSTAFVIATSDAYMLDSDGTWKVI